MRRAILLTACGCLIGATALLTGGCQRNPGQAAGARTPGPAATASVADGSASVQPTTTAVPAPSAIPDGPTNAQATHRPDKNAQSLSNDGTKGTGGNTTKATASPGSHSALMGLTLGLTADQVTAKYGKPQQIYAMDDTADPLTVYDYNQFSVGFNTKGALVFVDVASSDADPGLNGLRLGQTSDDALKALGKPDVNTNYVLAYNTKTTVLKIDVDPKTKEIMSIKLFGATE